MENLSFSPDDSSSPKENVNLRHYWHVVLERRWLVITAFISVFILSLIYLYKAPRIYEATARMEIARESENVLSLKEVLSIEGQELDYRQTQYKKLKSRTLINSVVSQLHLERDPRYAKQRDFFRAVEADIQIVPIRLSRLVDIKVQHPNPQTAAKIANTLVTQFIEDNLTLRRDKWNKLAKFLNNEAEVLKVDVETADRALAKYRKEKQSVSLEDSKNIELQALVQARTDLSHAQSESAVAQTNAAEVTRWEQEGVPLENIPQVAEEIAIKDLQNKLEVEKTRLESLLTRYKSKWPQVQESRAAIAQLTRSINERATQIIGTIKRKAELYKATEETLQDQVRQKEKKVMELSEQRIEYDGLNRDLQSKRDLLNKVLDELQKTRITSNDKSNNMREDYSAQAPLKPIKPRFILTLFLGLFGGFGVAIALAFFVNYLDDSIKSQDDVETYLRLPFLGYVPNIKTNSLVERDLQAHVHPRSNAAEGFRTIRAAISLMPKAEKFRTLTVTSTIPSEGKSLLASNLAIVSAQTGLKTLLVDADLRRPSVHKAFQLHSPVGLSAYLTEEINGFEECIHSTEVPNLDVVCCGAIPSTPSELIGSRRMMQFLQEVRVRYDRIVLDCPPVSAVSDPLVLASKSDGVIFVTKFNKIRREHARRTIQRLQDAGIHILGVILNDIDFEGKDSYYYSYYYYQNRYYASHYKSEKNGSEKASTPEKPKRA